MQVQAPGEGPEIPSDTPFHTGHGCEKNCVPGDARSITDADILAKTIKISRDLTPVLYGLPEPHHAAFYGSFVIDTLAERDHIAFHSSPDADAANKRDQIAIDRALDVYRIAKDDQRVIDGRVGRDIHRLNTSPHIERIARGREYGQHGNHAEDCASCRRVAEQQDRPK